MAAILAFLPLWLTSCAASNEVVPVTMPTAPAGLVACADTAMPGLPGAVGTALTKAQAAEALVDNRAAALAAHRCAVAWREFYGDLRAALTKAQAGNNAR